jgi:Flp pilus assembly pilin Flp
MTQSKHTNLQQHGFLTRIRARLRSLASDRIGATTVEYIVLVAFIALGGIAAVKGIRDKIGSAAQKTGAGIESFKAVEGTQEGG